MITLDATEFEDYKTDAINEKVGSICIFDDCHTKYTYNFKSHGLLLMYVTNDTLRIVELKKYFS